MGGTIAAQSASAQGSRFVVTLRRHASSSRFHAPQTDLTPRVDVAYSVARHRFDTWRSSAALSFSGNETDAAPRHLRNATLTYQPPVPNGGRIQREWSGMSDYWRDQANTIRSDGYDVFHLRASYVVARRAELFVRAMNVTDETYSTQSRFGFRDVPWNADLGKYRTVYAGVRARLW